MTFGIGRPMHGGLNSSELRSLGLRHEDVLDFSISVNPLGPSPLVIKAANNANLATYPDTDCVQLRSAIGRELSAAPDSILVGNGSTELIHLLARAFLKEDDSAFIFTPTFSEYKAACRLQGVAPVALSPDGRQFQWDVQAAIDAISQVKPALSFLCNPNNPTGVYLRADEVFEIAAALRDIGLLVLDEAYLSFVEKRWDSLELLTMPNVILLRSMTKDYALTGLRLGYMLATEDVVGHVKQYQYSWSVNGPAQAAGIAAISDGLHLEQGIEAVRIGKEYLAEVADLLSLDYAPSSANFLTLKVGRATEIRRRLLTNHSVCVRDCTSFGLPEYVRIGIRSMDDNRKLVHALTKVLQDR